MQTTKLKNSTSVFALMRNRFATVGVAVATGMAGITPAYATIDNTVTVTGTAPDSSSVTDSATENVDVLDAAPNMTVTKVATYDLGAGTVTANGTSDNVPAGTVITYTYTVENTGNVGLADVSLSDSHATDADGSLTTITMGALTDNGTGGDSTDDAADEEWDYLAPGDLVTWTASYTVTAADISGESANGDGTLDNTVTASGGYVDATGSPDTYTETADESVDLEDVDASLAVAKVGTFNLGAGVVTADGSTDNVPVGTVITYTYTITNDGNVPITGISLGDTHNGSGTAPAPDADGATLTDNAPTLDSTNTTTGDSQWDVLAPGDVLTVTDTYTVTQDDVDQLQ